MDIDKEMYDKIMLIGEMVDEVVEKCFADKGMGYIMAYNASKYWENVIRMVREEEIE